MDSYCREKVVKWSSTHTTGSNSGEATLAQCALRLFDLTCEEVCALLETVDLSGTYITLSIVLWVRPIRHWEEFSPCTRAFLGASLVQDE